MYALLEFEIKSKSWSRLPMSKAHAGGLSASGFFLKAGGLGGGPFLADTGCTGANFLTSERMMVWMSSLVIDSE